MRCRDIVERIESLQPDARPDEVARLALLLVNVSPDLDELLDQSRFLERWREVGLRLEQASDQHAAMAEELDALSRSGATTLSLEQVWSLLRAVKVQNAILGLYLGDGCRSTA